MTFGRRYHGTTYRLNYRPPQRKLTPTEEQTIVQYILTLDSRGFAPRLCEVADIADKLLGIRSEELVGKNWAGRFITRSNDLKMAFTSKGLSEDISGRSYDNWHVVRASTRDKSQVWCL